MGAGCWRRGAPRAASGCRPEAARQRRPAIAATRFSAGGGLARLKTRADFLRVAAARGKAATPGLVLQAARRPPAGESDGAAMRFGITASRKVGNAVARNRAKRRLREAAALVLPRAGKPGTDYVLIARAGTTERPFEALLADLESALHRVRRAGG